MHDGLVARSPCSRRTSPGMGKQRPYVATTEQVWALHDTVPVGVRPAILLGAHAGLRLAEAAALRPEDVDFMRGIVNPVIQWPNDPLKSETSRTAIPIPQEMALELAEAVRLGNGQTIVTDEWGKPAGPWTIERAVRAARLMVGGLPPDFRFHDLRHYCASFVDRLGTRREGRPSPPSARVRQDHARHLRSSLARQGRLFSGRCRGRLRGAERISCGIPAESGPLRYSETRETSWNPRGFCASSDQMS